jgi:hypothetical protein
VECIATVSLRWLDVTNPIYMDDTYFAIWPQGGVRRSSIGTLRNEIGMDAYLCDCTRLSEMRRDLDAGRDRSSRSVAAR